MRSDGFIKRAASLFIAVLVIYIFTFSAIEHVRTRRGPWRITFGKATSGEAAMFIDQPKLAVANLQIIFTGATNVTFTGTTNEFALVQPRPVPFDVPYGRCVFLDLTSLPGTVVFEMFGHEIQLLPRVLTIDHVEQPWQANKTIFLSPVDVSGVATNRVQ